MLPLKSSPTFNKIRNFCSPRERKRILETISISTSYHCNVCFHDWQEDPNNEKTAECPRCKRRQESGYNDVMNAVMETIDSHFRLLSRYMMESLDGLRDEISDAIEHNLSRKHK
jgi:hypothetical protein